MPFSGTDPDSESLGSLSTSLRGDVNTNSNPQLRGRSHQPVDFLPRCIPTGLAKSSLFCGDEISLCSSFGLVQILRLS